MKQFIQNYELFERSYILIFWTFPSDINFDRLFFVYGNEESMENQIRFTFPSDINFDCLFFVYGNEESMENQIRFNL